MNFPKKNMRCINKTNFFQSFYLIKVVFIQTTFILIFIVGPMLIVVVVRIHNVIKLGILWFEIFGFEKLRRKKMKIERKVEEG